MKRLATLAVSALLVGSLSYAADTENKASATTDTSHNPITGSDTTTKKMKKKTKDAAGAHETSVTEKTKVSKDGTAETTTKTEETTTHKK